MGSKQKKSKTLSFEEEFEQRQKEKQEWIAKAETDWETMFVPKPQSDSEFDPDEEEEPEKSEMQQLISLLKENNKIQKKQLRRMKAIQMEIRFQTKILIHVGVAGTDPSIAHPHDVSHAYADLRDMFGLHRMQFSERMRNGSLWNTNPWEKAGDMDDDEE